MTVIHHLALTSPGIDASSLKGQNYGWLVLAFFGGVLLAIILMMVFAKDFENPNILAQVAGVLVGFTPMAILMLTGPSPSEVDSHNRVLAQAAYPKFPVNNDSLICLSVLAGDNKMDKPCEVSKEVTATAVTTLRLTKVDGRVVLTKHIDPVVTDELS